MSSLPITTSAQVLAETRAWVRLAVVGLNLCPFAKAPMVKDQIRYVVSEAADPTTLLEQLRDELGLLAQADPQVHETTLLIHPHVLGDFDEFNDFLDLVDALLETLGLVGRLQVAPFHPRFRFADTDDDDLGNATNQAPYPTLHLLLEDSIERAVDSIPDPEVIYEANIRTLETLGADGWAALQARCRAPGG